MEADEIRCCGNCALCVHTYIGRECSLTDNSVDDTQAACVAAELPAVNLTELYARLDEEQRPFEMHVSKARKGIRDVLIFCNDAEYFNNLLNGYKAK